MLRASARASGHTVEIDAVADRSSIAMIPHGNQLIDLVDAVVDRDTVALVRARERLAETAGVDALIEAAGVIANFEMMTRIADATGARHTNERLTQVTDVRAALALDHFVSARGVVDRREDSR